MLVPFDLNGGEVRMYQDRDAMHEALAMQTPVDSWEAVCDKGREAADGMDAGRWILGELASSVQTHWGDTRLDDFAIAVAVEKKRIYEYRGVYRFYEFSATAEFRADNPMLRYSHYRDAMRLGDEHKAMAFLNMCSLAGLTVEQARLKLVELLGKPTPPKKLADLTVPWHDAANAVAGYFMVNDTVRPDQVRITIHEA